MASGITRSRFTAPLAEALGIKKAVLYHRLEAAGLQSPFLDVEAALNAVERDPNLLMKAKKFRLRMENDSLFRELIMGPQKAANKKSAPPEPATVVKKTASKPNGKGHEEKKDYRPQLIRRLVDVLWREGEETREAARQRAWKILKEGGFKGKTLSWRDEAKVVAIFTKARIDLSKFEYVTTSPPGNSLVVAPPQPLPTTPNPNNDNLPVSTFDGGIIDMILPLCEPKHREQVTEILRKAIAAVEHMGERMNSTVDRLSNTVADLKAGADVARSAKTALEQFENAWFQRMGKREVPYPINMVFDALGEFRAPPPPTRPRP